MDYNKLCINCMHEKSNDSHVCPHCGFDDRTYTYPPYVLQPFTPLNGKYIIGKMLGAGGFGITYIAMDTALDKVVAVKEFFVQQSMYRHTTISSDVTVSTTSHGQQKIYDVNRIKFEQEAKTLARLTNTPGIVRVYDYFRENNTSYMVLEYLSGMTLKDYVKRQGGRLSYDEVIRKLTPVMTSLDLLHKTALASDTDQDNLSAGRQSGIIHRDISPDNIMVSDEGKLTLFDFGGAKIQHEVKSYVILAKAGYSPLEQVQSDGETGPWVDVYAMAATIYYCLCGHIPVESTRRASDGDTLAKPSAEGIKLTARQEQVLLKGLALRYKDRYQSMEEFRDALLTASGSSPKPVKMFAVLIPIVVSALAAVVIFAARNIGSNNMVASNQRGQVETQFQIENGDETITEELKEEATQKSTEELMEELTERPMEEPTGEPTERITEQPTEEPTEELTEEPTEKKKAAEDIISEYNRGLLTFNEAAAQMEDSDSPTTGMETLDRLKESKEAYRKGNQYAEDSNMQKEALEQYGKVIEDDINYEDAQSQISEICNWQVVNCKNDVSQLVSEKKYDEALERIQKAREIVPDDVELISLWDKTVSEYSEYAARRADVLIKEKEFDDAREVLKKAYTATGEDELLDKMDEVDEMETSFQKAEEAARKAEEEEAKKAAAIEAEEGIHQYDLYYTDGTWEDALRSCQDKGGYLVHINSQEELDYIIEGLDGYELRNTRFYIGARRDLSDTQYYWVDENNSLYGDAINNKSWWLTGEPSLYDANDSRKPVENVVELFFSTKENRWVLNDIPDDLPTYVSSTGKNIGFICEFDDE